MIGSAHFRVEIEVNEPGRYLLLYWYLICFRLLEYIFTLLAACGHCMDLYGIDLMINACDIYEGYMGTSRATYIQSQNLQHQRNFLR